MDRERTQRWCVGREDSEMGGGNGCGGGKAPDARKTFLNRAGEPPDIHAGWGPRLFLKTKGRHESRACRTSGRRQASARSLPPKTAESPAKKIFPRATSGIVREAFFLAVWRSASSPGSPKKRDAFRRSFVAVPRRRGTFLPPVFSSPADPESATLFPPASFLRSAQLLRLST